MRASLIIHERRGRWARQLRSRVAAWSVHLTESRSRDDIKFAAAKSASPLILMDLGNRLRPGLDDLDFTARHAPNALILVLDGTRTPGFATLARELGATLVLPAMVPPPSVLEILARWLPIARSRSETDGWAEDRRPEPEPWQLYLDVPVGTRSLVVS